MDASEVIKKIIDGNNRFIKKHDINYFVNHMVAQHPFITLVSCSDSRIQPDVILPDAINKIFLIENIGNQILSNEGSVDYGIYHLKTPVLLILGHCDCGAIKAYMKGHEHELDSIKKELDTLSSHISKNNAEDEFEKDLLDNIQKNVDYQVDVAAIKYKDLIQEEKLTVIGAFYDFKNDFGMRHGRVIILNVNGETDETKIRSLSIFENIKQEDILTGRL